MIVRKKTLSKLDPRSRGTGSCLFFYFNFSISLDTMYIALVSSVVCLGKFKSDHAAQLKSWRRYQFLFLFQFQYFSGHHVYSISIFSSLAWQAQFWSRSSTLIMQLNSDHAAQLRSWKRFLLWGILVWMIIFIQIAFNAVDTYVKSATYLFVQFNSNGETGSFEIIPEWIFTSNYWQCGGCFA